MTPQEQQMIDGLISRIRSTPAQEKDTAAEQHIQQSLANVPDALYILVQTVLVQQYGLEQAQGQLEDLKSQNSALQDQLQQVQQAHEQAKNSGGSFLSHIFGSGSSASAPPPTPNPGYQPVNSGNYGAGSPAQPPYSAQGYPAQSYPAQAYPPAGGGGGMFGGGGGGGGFLRGALQTAAGVAAGAVAFQGIEDLFHGFGGGGGERGFGGPGMGGGETVVNNYYDDDRGGNDRGDRGDTGNFYNPSDDASRDLGNDTQQFAGNTNDSGFNDDDTSNFDDNAGFDDGGGDDMSGNL